MACSTQFYPEGFTYAVLSPTTTVERSNITGEWSRCILPSDLSKITLEIAKFNSNAMFAGLAFIVFVGVRSMSKVHWDYFRLIAIYAAATACVPLMIGPLGLNYYPGFNRLDGVGVLIHNCAELFLIGSLWNGQRSREISGRSVWIALAYIWGMLMVLTLVTNLRVLFFIAMLQGAAWDYLLIYSFLLAAYLTSQNDHGDCCKKKSSFWWGVGAAIMHVLSIQALFFGFALAWRILALLTILFLVPNFFVYTVFAVSAHGGKGRICGPERPKTAADFDTLEMEIGAVERAKSRKNTMDAPTVETFTKSISGRSSSYSARRVKSAAINTDPRFTEADREELSRLVDETGSEDVLYFGMRHRMGGRMFPRVFALAFLSSLLNTLIVFFSPCFIDSGKLQGGCS